MKKTIIISAIALCFSITTINAKSINHNTKDYSIETVLQVSPFCVSIAKGDMDTVKKLIDLGVDVNKKSNGMTPLMYAAKFNRTDILKLLISKGAKLKVKCNRGLTAVKYAKQSNAKEALAILEEALR
ncbi:ankyrin repeat domain-containing protein [Sabulilitoribacter arenilitoris]|uniref:Ankyrin repeat domain-containing protein n=1 Tax=Wocania arenilitoris TaxID=2044858 RepID=A0AAE3JQ41_9FLAO|nr:ankyrin repeat domain-containing protein [Wocania arenilitoris]MCF7568840.1 ankyrin repeat domain-containing protein [Wocania arenilitoris]